MIIFIAVAYAAGFAAMLALFAAATSRLARIQSAGLLTQLATSACIDVTVLDAAGGVTAPGVNVSASMGDPRLSLASKADQMDGLLRGMYLGFTATPQYPAASLYNLLTVGSLKVSVWAFNSAQPGGGAASAVVQSPWAAARMFVAKARTVAFNPAAAPASLPVREAVNTTADFLFMLANGPAPIVPALVTAQGLEADQERADLQADVAAALTIMLLVMAVFFGATAYFRSLLHKLAAARISLFMVFLIIPRPLLLRLASKSTRLASENDDLDGENADEDDEEDTDWLQAQRRFEESLKEEKKEEDRADVAAAAAAAPRMRHRGSITASLQSLKAALPLLLPSALKRSRFFASLSSSVAPAPEAGGNITGTMVRTIGSHLVPVSHRPTCARLTG